VKDEGRIMKEETESPCLEPLQKECDELLAIFTAISKKCKKNSD